MDFFSLHTFRNAGYFIITIFDFDTSGLIPLLRNMLHNGREGQKKWQKMGSGACDLNPFFATFQGGTSFVRIKVIIAFFAYIQGRRRR